MTNIVSENIKSKMCCCIHRNKINKCAVDMDVDFVVISRSRVCMCFDYDLCIQYVEIILFKPKAAKACKRKCLGIFCFEGGFSH